MTIGFILHTLIILSIGFGLSKHEMLNWRVVFWTGLLLKLLAGVGVGLLYMHYYAEGGDTLGYFSDGTKMASLGRANGTAYLNFLFGAATSIEGLTLTEPRALFMSKLVSLFCLLTHDNYWLTAGYLSLIGFLASWFLVKEFIAIDSRWKYAASIAFLFFPSVMFWSAGIVKECVAMSCLYFIVLVLLRIWRSKKMPLTTWLILPVALWILWNLKYYYLAVLLPVAATLLVMHRLVLPRVKFDVWVKAVVWGVVFLIPLYVVSLVHPNFYPERFLTVIVENYRAFEKLSAPEDRVAYSNLEPTVHHVIANAAPALIAALFRPFIWEAGNVLQIFSALENLFVLVFTLATLFHLKQAVDSPYRQLIFSGLLYVILLAVFLALSTPNFGTLIRYRVGFMSFFVMIVLAANPLLILIINKIDLYRKRFFNLF